MSNQIDDKMLSDWRINYGLDTRTPAEAMRWWYDRMDGKAPAGAVAALGLCIDEIERLRAALIPAMGIVQRERVRIAYNAKGAPPAIEIGYADILHRLDAVIAQADAALGSER